MPCHVALQIQDAKDKNEQGRKSRVLLSLQKEEKWYKQVAETSIFTTLLSPSGNMIIIK
jgi:hypothetical protein